ncbi:alpha/beta hydrolase [Brachybacterium halotolerans subsp. kimchii]|uniref:alpha/beta fold hydrolase n=1 Tax=Brachybacterium halotolerans TaxID=2795215 RepID=UPI001E48DC28|nr:alpha/beta fold hydrolase [Brachybacterium halotolerans]UEJ81242.1 alpha/beta hydrolase [Brachybacterium halotolerans subsp. kimchii]
MPKIPSPADGARIAYDVTGSGPAAVLLHGSVLSRAIWRAYGYVDALKSDRTVIRIDLRGHGRSDAPHEASAYTQGAFVADLMAVLDAEGIERAALIGYSLGARIAVTAAVRRPERVTHLVSLGGSASAQQGSVDTVFFPGTVETLRSEGMEGFCQAQGLGPEVTGRRDRGTRTAFLAADPLAMAALFTATETTPGIPDAELSACPVPALWMAGDRDHPRFEESERAAALMPDARFVPLPGRTHAATLAPAEPILEQVLPMLGAASSSTSASAPSPASTRQESA